MSSPPDESGTQPVQLETLNTFRCAVGIEPALIGADLQFDQEGVRIRIKLPSADRINKPIHEDTFDTDISVTAHELTKPPTPLAYGVYSIFVLTYPNEPFDLPNDPESVKALSSGNRSLLRIIETGSYLADRAFERWAGVLRWKSGAHWLARRRRPQHPHQWRGEVRLRESGQRLAGLSHGNMGVSHVGFNVTTKHWLQTEQALQAGESSPIYFDLLHDAQWVLETEELRRCVIDAAAACEVYMKTKVLDALPSGISPTVRRYTSRANVSKFYGDFFPDILPGGRSNPTWEAIKGDINALFTERNTLLHDGTHEHLTHTDCARYVAAARTLLSIV